jgi:hypothetical protein
MGCIHQKDLYSVTQHNYCSFKLKAVALIRASNTSLNLRRSLYSIRELSFRDYLGTEGERIDIEIIVDLNEIVEDRHPLVQTSHERPFR